MSQRERIYRNTEGAPTKEGSLLVRENEKEREKQENCKGNEIQINELTSEEGGW